MSWEHSKLQALAIAENLRTTTAENTQLKTELSKSQVLLTQLEVRMSLHNRRDATWLYNLTIFSLQTKLKYIATFENEDVDAEIKIVQDQLLEAAVNEVPHCLLFICQL